MINIPFIFNQYVVPFCNSNFALVVVTLITGFFAWRVYKNQKKDEKRNAASILLLEIKSAEDALRKVDENKPISGIDDPDVFLMRSANWDKYKYLFVSEFKDDNEFNKISDFYIKCKEYDDAVRLRNSSFYHNQKQLRKTTHEILVGYTKEYVSNLLKEKDVDKIEKLNLEFAKIKQKFKDVYLGDNADIFTYLPKQPFTNAKRTLNTIDRNLSTSSAGQVLDNIAKPKRRFCNR
jgi:nitrogen fixation-related uncharacterized protein